MFAAVLVLAAATAGPVHQHSKDRTCSAKNSQMEMNRCAEQQFERADKVLKVTLARAGALAKDNSVKTRLLVGSENAWVKFRDSECALVADEDRGGSIAPQSYRECLTDLTKERTKDLAEFAEGWKAR